MKIFFKRSFIYFLMASSLSGVSATFGQESKPKYGPNASPKALPLFHSREYFQSKDHPSPDFWALIGYYVPQQNDYSCSAASVSMILNAARARLHKTSEDALVTQKTLLEKIQVENWAQRLSAEGWKGSHGTSLDELARVTEASFKAFGFPQVKVKTVHVDRSSAEMKSRLVKDLIENEASATNFILANFNQRSYTDDSDAGHIAPVAAYDSQKGRVLVLDPDRQWYEPYWVSVDVFLKGLATKDSGGKAYRGYLLIDAGP
jgi:hypothetical protein